MLLVIFELTIVRAILRIVSVDLRDASTKKQVISLTGKTTQMSPPNNARIPVVLTSNFAASCARVPRLLAELEYCNAFLESRLRRLRDEQTLCVHPGVTFKLPSFVSTKSATVH